MKKICLLLSIMLVLTSVSIPALADTAAGEVTTKSVTEDKLMIFSEDFQDMRNYNNVLGTYNRTDNAFLPTGWADARNLAAFTASADMTSGFKLTPNYTDYWNNDDLGIFTSDNGNGGWTKASLHFHNNVSGIQGNIALGISTSGGGAGYNSSNGSGAEHGGFVKYFTNGVATGDFTLEFDVLVKNGGQWSLGLIPYDNYDAAITMGSYGSSSSNPTKNYAWNRNNNWAANKYLLERATLSHVIGQMKNDASLYVPNGVGKAFNTTNFAPLKDGNGNNATMTNTFTNGDSSQLNHIKIEFNTTSGVHKVTVTDGALGTTNTYDWVDATPGRFEKGIMGITLRKYNDTDALWSRVLFDNIQVYKKNAYFIDQDFAGYNTTSNRIPGGWYRWLDQLARKGTVANTVLTNNLVNSTAGVTGESGDYAMKLNAVNGNLMQEIYMTLFPKPAIGGHPTSIEFDLKSDADTSWQLHQLDQEYIFALKGYNETGTKENGALLEPGATWKTFSANNAILGYSGWNGNKDFTANQVMGAKTGVSGNTYRVSDASGKGFDITYGSYYNWAYTGGVDLSDGYDGVFYYPESDAEGKWNHYRVTVIPDGAKTKYEIAIYPSGMTEDEANDEGKASYGYAETNRNSVSKPMCGIGFLALSNSATATGSIAIDNLKVYEAKARYDEAEDITYYDEVTEYQNAAIEGVTVEYADGTSAPLTNNSVISKAAKRLVVKFTEPVAMQSGAERSQILNECMTSTVANTDTKSEWTEEDMRYFNVFDTIDKAITLRRNYSIGERNIATLPEVKKYLAANRYSFYIELTEDMFTENKGYVLTVSPNITFQNSAYSSLSEGLEINFATEIGNGFEYNQISLVKSADLQPITTIDEIKAELAANDNQLTLKVNGANTTATDITLTLLAAQYRGGADDKSLEKVNLSDITLTPGFMKDKIYTITVDPTWVNSDAGIDELKCFLWKLDTMIPVGDAVAISK